MRRALFRLDGDGKRQAFAHRGRQARDFEPTFIRHEAQRDWLGASRNRPKLEAAIARRRLTRDGVDQKAITPAGRDKGRLLLLRRIKHRDIARRRETRRCRDVERERGGNRRRRRGRPAPERKRSPETPLSGLILDPARNAVPELGRRLGRRRQCRERVKLLLPERDRLTQRRVIGQRFLDFARCGVVEKAQHIFAGHHIELVAVRGDHGSRQPLSERRPRRTQLLTLPSGAGKRAAISACEKPSTKASTIERRCFSSSSSRQRRSASCLSFISIAPTISNSSATSPSVGSSLSTSRLSFLTASSARKRTMPVSHAAAVPRSGAKLAAFCHTCTKASC